MIENVIKKCHPIIDVGTSLGTIGLTAEEIKAILPELRKAVIDEVIDYIEDGLESSSATRWDGRLTESTCVTDVGYLVDWWEETGREELERLKEETL